MSAAAAVLLGLTLVVAAGDLLALTRKDAALGYLCKLLVLLFLVLVAVELGSPDSSATAWVVLALVLSGVGDALLLVDREKLFVLALTMFVATHVAYVGAMVTLGVDGGGLLLGLLLVTAVVVAVGRKILDGVKERRPDLVPEIQLYIGASSAVIVVAFGAGRLVGIVGASLFSAADALGGWNRFVQAHPLLPLAGAAAYHLGQIGLVLILV